MRYTTRPMLGVLLAMVLGTAGFAEETKAPWWHFGMGKSAPATPASMTAAPTLTPSQTLTPPATSSTAAAPVAEDKTWLKWPSLPKMKWSETTVTEVSPVHAAKIVDEAASRPLRQADSRRQAAQHLGAAASGSHCRRSEGRHLEEGERRHSHRLA